MTCAGIQCSGAAYQGIAGSCTCALYYGGVVTYIGGVLGGCTLACPADTFAINKYTSCSGCSLGSSNPANNMLNYCSCKPGFYQASNSGRSDLTNACSPCPSGKFQRLGEKSSCSTCPTGSSSVTGASFCTCSVNYYR